MIDIPGYLLGMQLHAGQTSFVYRATRLLDQAAVAIKFLRNEFPTASETQRYAREFAVAGGLRLKGCVRVLALERAQHRSVLIYDDDGSVSLRRLFAGRQLDVDTWLHIAIETTRCLQELHAQKLVHRDINPSNVVMNAVTQSIKLTDLELAGPATGVDDPSERVFGTVAYMAPEQSGRIRCAVDMRSDLYSLGAMLFELATGRAVFNGADDLSLMHAHLALQPESPSQINSSFPNILSKIVLRLLAKSPNDRYQSARGLLNDLTRAKDTLKSTSDPKELNFELGQLDHANALASADLLYGREEARYRLAQAIQQIADENSRAWISIAGLAGTGKSLLVERYGELRADAQGAPNVPVYMGRCERLEQNIPYSGLARALHRLLQHWLGLEQVALEPIKRSLTSALGVNAGVLLPLLPELPKLLGRLPPVLPLGSGAEQARFQLAVRAFFQVCCQLQKPLLIALDDFHWADQATLTLLEKLLTSDLMGWALITTERSEEREGNLQAWRERILAAGVYGRLIELGPLTAAHIEAMLQDGLGEFDQGPGMRQKLAELVLQKTLGNPYFVRQFLRTLISQDLLQRDPSNGSWRFNPRTIAEQNLTDNVLTLLGQRVSGLPNTERDLLRMAACIGLQFDVQTLSALGTVATDTKALCESLVQSGLLLVSEASSVHGECFRFAHERLREAVLSACSDDAAARWHLQIGELWQRQLSQNPESRSIFDVVSQLNRGISLIESDGGRMALVELNVQAAQAARSQTAYDAALEYASFAASSLPFSAFSAADSGQSPADETASKPELVLETYRLLAECQAATGALEPAVEVFQQALALSQDPIQNAKTRERLSDALQSSGRAAEALVEVQRALGLLGQTLEFGTAHQADEQDALVRALSEPSALHRFAALETAQGTAAQIGALYDKAIISVYFSCPENLAFVTARSVKHVLDSGLTPEAGIALGWWGMILVMFDKHPLAAQYAQFALDTHTRFGNNYYGGGAKMLAHAMSLCWTRAYAENIAGAEDSYVLCHQSGNLQFASYGLIVVHIGHVAQAADLNLMLTSCERWREYCERYVPLELGQAQIRSYCLRQLMGQSPKALDVEHIISTYEAQNNHTDVCESLTEMARVAMLMDRHELALSYAERAAPMFAAGAAGTLLLNYLHHVVLAISSARALGPNLAIEQRERLQAQYQHSADKVRDWSQHCLENFAAYCDLVLAEGCRALGLVDQDQAQLERASVHYLSAISHAQAHKQTLLQAQATQYLAELFQLRGHSFASGLLKDAEQLYRRAGAMFKVGEAAAGSRHETRPLTTPGETLRTHRSSGSGAQAVDLLSVLKASEAMASEIHFDHLITRLLKIAIENAGAQRGVIVLKSGDGFMVRASSEHGCVNLPVEGYRQVPQKLIAYVSRALVPVVLEDGASAGQFRDDPYFSEHKIRSVLCSPLLRQGDLRGLLYLENNAVAAAFTHERLETLNMLLSSAAIAIENAELYSAQQRYTEQLEIRVRERTAELERVNQALARLAEVDGLTQLSNRRTFDLFCQKLADQGGTVGLALCDVDDFKSYNDHYGHPAGDDVLRKVASALKLLDLPIPSIVARYGGEEFAIVFQVAEAQAALTCGANANQMIAALTIPHDHARAAAHVTLSVGCAWTPRLTRDGIAELISKADAALYEAKRGGRNRAVLG